MLLLFLLDKICFEGPQQNAPNNCETNTNNTNTRPGMPSRRSTFDASTRKFDGFLRRMVGLFHALVSHLSCGVHEIQSYLSAQTKNYGAMVEF